jgi:uncharacterized protein (UPF0276 family)
VREVLDRRPAVPWFEIHSENYFADGGPVLAALEQIRADYPVALHGVGLSLGSTDPLDREHLRKLKRLADRIDPALVSEHLCWSSVDGRHFNDLLPLPYNEEALDHVCARVSAVQDYLDRTIAVENVSSYYAFPGVDRAGVRVHGRRGRAHGRKTSGRREQRLRQRAQSRHRSCRLSLRRSPPLRWPRSTSRASMTAAPS